MDRIRAEQVFREYSEKFDISDVKITLKINHTFRVAEIADRIAGSLKADRDFAWFLGLLHDIARFEQQTRYGTFKDAKSVDHAEFGADLLFKGDRLVEAFPQYTGVPDWEGVAETAIRLHNKLNLPDGLDKTTYLYTTILRDADKCDIFRVLTEPPYDERNERICTASEPAGNAVLDCVREHRCVPRTFELTELEGLMSQCCMAFELVYPESRKIVSEQGYLDKLLSVGTEGAVKEQMEMLRAEIKTAWEVSDFQISTH